MLYGQGMHIKARFISAAEFYCGETGHKCNYDI